jgi:hypothetical protein
MRRYERASTLLTSNRPVEDWGKLLGASAAVTATLGSITPPRTAARVRGAKLAYQNRLARTASGRVEQPSLGPTHRWRVLK